MRTIVQLIRKPLGGARAILLAATAALSVSGCQSPDGSGPSNSPVPRLSGDIRLDVRTSKVKYVVGDLFTFSVTPSMDCYLKVSSVDSTGYVSNIYPNAHAANRRFRGGEAASFPGTLGSFQLRVKPPLGKETLVIDATAANVETNRGLPGERGLEVEPAGSSGQKGRAEIDYWIVDKVAPTSLNGSGDLAFPINLTPEQADQIIDRILEGWEIETYPGRHWSANKWVDFVVLPTRGKAEANLVLKRTKALLASGRYSRYGETAACEAFGDALAEVYEGDLWDDAEWDWF